MTPFSSLAVTATIILLMVARNCHCEKVHAKEKKVQTPELWSALGCMITDDDITKCVRDRATDTNGMHINDFPQCHIIFEVDYPFLSPFYNFKSLKDLELSCNDNTHIQDRYFQYYFLHYQKLNFAPINV
jgi:hypothetical protein